MSSFKSTTATMDTRDWSLCFIICQSDKSNEKTLNPSSSLKLRNNPEQCSACYKEIIDNIQELKELGEVPDFIIIIMIIIIIIIMQYIYIAQHYIRFFAL